MKSGIYLIKSTVNGKEYVGSAVDLKHRKYVHFWSLKRGGHHCIHLQRHYNKHGDVFEFSVLKKCHKNELIWWEQYFIDTMQPSFNTCKIAGSSLGTKRTKEQIEKMMGSNNPMYGKTGSMKGRHHTEDSLLKMRGSNHHMYGKIGPMKGKHHTEEAKRRISEAKSKLSNADIIEANRLYDSGMTQEEVGAILCVSQQTISRCLINPRTLSEASKGRKHLPEPIAKRSKALRKLSDADIIEANRLYQTGLTPKVIGAKFNVGATTIIRYIDNPRSMSEAKKGKRLSVEACAARRKLSDADIVEIKRLKKSGLTYKAIGVISNVSAATIWNYLNCY